MKVWNKIKQNENLMRFIETTQKRITDSEMSTTCRRCLLFTLVFISIDYCFW